MPTKMMSKQTATPMKLMVMITKTDIEKKTQNKKFTGT